RRLVAALKSKLRRDLPRDCYRSGCQGTVEMRGARLFRILLYDYVAVLAVFDRSFNIDVDKKLRRRVRFSRCVPQRRDDIRSFAVGIGESEILAFRRILEMILLDRKSVV